MNKLNQVKILTMKISWKPVAIALITANAFFAACNDTDNGDANNNDTTATTKNEAEDQNDSALSTKAAEKDAQFIVDVVAANYGEVKLAQLAEQKSSNKEIKDVAQMLEADHTAVLNDLKAMASRKGITVPTEESGEAKDKLKELTDEKASNFDKEWCETLMDNHKNSISKFENEANDASDPDLKNFVNTVLPKLRTHHDKLMECHKKLK
jgi:predicted outer membrane protein